MIIRIAKRATGTSRWVLETTLQIALEPQNGTYGTPVRTVLQIQNLLNAGIVGGVPFPLLQSIEEHFTEKQHLGS